MSIESQIAYFTDAGDEPVSPPTHQMQLSERIECAIDEAFASTKHVENWDTTDRLALWAEVNSALRELDSLTNGRLRKLTLIATPEPNGGVAKREIVPAGHPEKVLFDVGTLATCAQNATTSEAQKGSRLVFGRAFDLLQSNTSNLDLLSKYRNRSRTMTAGTVGNGTSSSNGTYAGSDNNSR